MPTPEGITMRPAGLDFGAVMSLAAPLGIDLVLLAELLPSIETAIINPKDYEEDDACP